MASIMLINQTPQLISFQANKPVKPIKPFKHEPLSIDLSKLYSQDEIKDILEKVGTLRNIPYNYPMRYSMQYLPKFEDIVINNKSMTNDTTVILQDGSVRHCGSWHDKEVAPEGSHKDIINEVKARIAGNQK